MQVSYAAVGGPGVIMRILCFFCSIISVCSSLAAVGFIWVSHCSPSRTKLAAKWKMSGGITLL